MTSPEIKNEENNFTKGINKKITLRGEKKKKLRGEKK